MSSNPDNEICQFTQKPFDCKNCNGHKEEWLNRGNHTVHMCHSVSGPLARNKKKDWDKMAKYMTKDDGSHVTGDWVHVEFMKYDAKGIKVIPLNKCDRFCFKNGCQGHEEKDK